MGKMNKYAIYAIMLIVSAMALLLPLYVWPREVASEFEGVMFRDGDPSYHETVSIEIEGHMNKRLFGGRTFLGTVSIDKMPVRDDFKSQRIQVKFNSAGLGRLVYLETVDGVRSLKTEGFMSMSPEAGSLTIIFLEGADAEDFDFAGGLLIAGPATDRDGAVAAANSMFGDFIEKPLE
ncbi:MAG: hypothetical protein JXB33_03070 [Clostridia bacterium]|nr:hypothetical protein [Clostridia bacterium]